jgi:hypothetical protein
MKMSVDEEEPIGCTAVVNRLCSSFECLQASVTPSSPRPAPPLDSKYLTQLSKTKKIQKTRT